MRPARTAARESSIFSPGDVPDLDGFWSLADSEREERLLRGIIQTHAYHFERNSAYRNTVAARGVGPWTHAAELPRLLRATSQAFKSYADVLGTSFPQDEPDGFVGWLAEQLSVDWRVGARPLGPRYPSLEDLLKAVERTGNGAGLTMLTSSGESGRVAVIPHDPVSTYLAAESFALSFQRYLGLRAQDTAIFMMPKRTRTAVARMTRLGVQRLGLARGGMRFTIPIAASPDQARLRIGRTYRSGWRGGVERMIYHPLAAFFQERVLEAHAVESAISRIIPAAARGDRVFLLGSPTQLQSMASLLLDGRRTLTLAPGSVLVTTGGTRGMRATSPLEMREQLQSTFRLTDGSPVPVRDVYGLAEANWAAMQCSQGKLSHPSVGARGHPRRKRDRASGGQGDGAARVLRPLRGR